jgi:hypothetical protein
MGIGAHSEEGRGEIYAYLPLVPSNDEQLTKIPPFSTRNPDYGFSIGRGAWRFQPGKWTAIAIRAKLNDIGAQNGRSSTFTELFSLNPVTSIC